MNQTKAKKIFDSFQLLKAVQKTGTGIDLARAKELAYLKGETKDGNKIIKRYKVIMGYPEATWRAFLAQPEINIKATTADRLVTIYETYIVKLKLKESDILGIDSNLLQRLAREVTKDNVREWIKKAESLSREDLYRELKFGDIKEEDCKPHEFESKLIKTCIKCGYKIVKK